MRSHLALFLFFSLSSSGLATITISTSNTNASNVVPPTAAATGPSFYYSNPSGGQDVASPPNWTQGTGVPCTPQGYQVNPNCRDPSQSLNFQVASSVATTSSAATFYVQYVSSASAPPAQPTTAPGIAISSIGTAVIPGFQYTTNVAAITSIPFSKICTALAVDGNVNAQCVMTTPTSPVSATLYVFADANGDGYWGPGEDMLVFTFTVQSSIPVNSSIESQIGLYSFQMFPGDGIVNILQPLPGGTGLAGAYAVNFYYMPGSDVYSAFNTNNDFQKINPDNSEPAANIPFSQIVLNPDGTLPTSTINSLSNGTSYYFRSSIVDAAGNIGYIELGTSGDDTPPNPPSPFQWHAARPDQIAGLLAKNGECFIATAAYGTPMARQVQILREFRDKILMKSKNGQKFIYWYYKNGKGLADKIRDRDDIRAVIRAFLYPLIGYGWLALKIGAFNSALLISTLLMFPLLLIQLRRSRKTLEDIS